MAISTDFTIDYANKRIKYTGVAAAVYSVNELYSYLMDTFDENVQMDDPVPMEALAAQQFKLINGWFLDDASTQYLTGDNTVNGGSSSKNGGSITTEGWTRVVDSEAGIVRVPVSSSTIVVGDVDNAITHADGDSGVLLDVEDGFLWIRPDSSAAANNFDSTSGTLTCNAHTATQTAAASTGETEWANIYSIGSGVTGRTLYIEQNGAVVDKWGDVYTTGHIDFLIRTKLLDSSINSGLVTVLCRDWGYTYDFFEVDLVNGGRLPAAISIAADPDNQTAVGTVEAYNIGVTFSSYTVDVDQSGATENYEIEIDLNNTHTVAEAYEYLKAITRNGQTGTIDSVQGQLYKAADPTYTPVKVAPFGSFAGGKFFGARGLHFKLAERPAAEANKYELIDSDGNTGIDEPTSISISVGNLTSGDAVFLALSTGVGSTTVDEDQFTTAAASGTYNGTGDGEVKLTETIPQDVPSAGYLRIGPNGDRYEYTSYSGDTFTLAGTLTTDYSSTNCYVPWIDKDSTGASISEGVSYVSDKNVVVRVRKKGIKPFQTTGQITDAGFSVTTIRTTDGVVT